MQKPSGRLGLQDGLQHRQQGASTPGSDVQSDLGSSLTVEVPVPAHTLDPFYPYAHPKKRLVRASAQSLSGRGLTGSADSQVISPAPGCTLGTHAPQLAAPQHRTAESHCSWGKGKGSSPLYELKAKARLLPWGNCTD